MNPGVSVELITLIMFGSLILFLGLGIHIAWTLAGISLLMTLWLWDFKALYLFITATYGIMGIFTFTAIPLYIYMGVLMKFSGMADALFHMFYIWSGPVRGGIAMGVVIISAIFAAMTGISGAACITMGLIALPAMRSRGYDKSLAIGTVIGPSALGILIPPSIVMIQLGIVAEISVGKLFFGGMVPGILMALLFIAYIGIKGWLQPQSCPAITEKYSLREKLLSIRSVAAPGLIILAVLGTIFFGLATPSEAAAVAVVALMVVLVFQRNLTWQMVRETNREAFRITALSMWIFFPAVCFANIYTALGGVEFVEEVVLGLGLGRYGTLLMIMGLIFIMGMVIDPIAIIWLVAPLSYPIIEALGFDPVWWGVLFVINIVMAYITPPFGANLFYMRAIAPPDISMGDIFNSAWPFVGVELVCTALVIIFPQLVLWLPKRMVTMR